MPRRGENIYKRKDGRWEGRYMKNDISKGRRKYGYVYGKTYRDVKEKLLSAKESELFPDYMTESSLNESVKEIEIKDMAIKWMNDITPRIKESTQVKYRNIIKHHVIPGFGTISCFKLTCSQVQEYCNMLLISGGKSGKGFAPKTVSDILSVLKSILKYASICEGVITCDLSSVIIKQSAKELRVFSVKEQEKLCEYLYTHLNRRNQGLLLCLFTGLRLGEICALRWEDVLINERTIYIRQTLQRIQVYDNSDKKTKVIFTIPKSAYSIRKIPLSEELFQVITSEGVPEKGFFLTDCSEHYLEPRTMQNHFKSVLHLCNIQKANFHTLRHTFATRCVEVGFDIKSLSEILGHANVNITLNRYVHPSMDLKLENMKKLSPFLPVR